MALQIMSDLHLEDPKGYHTFQIVPIAPHLALLGDIGTIGPHKDNFFRFLYKQLSKFRTVLFVPGNHEAYSSDWPSTLGILREFEKKVRNDWSLGEFVLLDREAYPLPGTDLTILGCSLFCSIPPDRENHELELALELSRDFYRTKHWDVAKHNAAHKRDLAWLNSQVVELEKRTRKIVIFTHWSPSVDARTKPPKCGAAFLNSFGTDLSNEICFKSDNVKLWAFGHTHYNCDFIFDREPVAGPLRLLTNQKGYHLTPSKGFDVKKTAIV